jgi:parallel beta-helix repeat protein
MVYRDGNNVYAKDSEGNVVCMNSATSCIKEAISYIRNKSTNFGEGGIIKIKEGSYMITEPISFPYGSLFIKVKGSKGTVLIPQGNINVFNFYVDQNGEAIRYVDIEDLYIMGDVNNRTATAFNFDVYDADGKLRYVALINIRNVVVHGVKRAVYAKNLWMAKFEDVEVQYSGVDVPLIFLDKSATDVTHNIYFDKVYIEDIRGTHSIIYAKDPVFDVVLNNTYIESYRQVPYLIYFENWSSKNVVSNCFIDGASSYAVRVGIHSVIKGNKITNSGGGIELGWHFNIVTDNIISVDNVGIRGSGGHSLVVSNNYIENSNIGIYLDWGSYYSTISGNVIYNVRNRGIHIYHSEQVRVIGNQIFVESGTAESGIYIQDPGKVIVMGNTIRGNLTNSIVEQNSNYNIIIGNVTEKPMVIVGPNTIIRDNIT